MHEAVRRRLRCPICHAGFAEDGAGLRCAGGHAFDRARQGYVNLLAGRAPRAADTPDMVAARAALLSSGAFDFLTRAVAAAAAARSGGWPHPPGLVVDAGGGTGHYLAAVLSELPGHHGVTLDLSRAAARRAARAHGRAAAAVCDVWRGLPVADQVADLVLNVFAPRNAAEFHRVLRPTGTLLVVAARPDHLVELVTRLRLVTVDTDKDRRLGYALGAHFVREDTATLVEPLTVAHQDATRLVAMGPSARHLTGAELAGRVAALPERLTVTASVSLQAWRPLTAGAG
jgi:23S rRNA (guanine745-N1)-methyltransferase